MEAVVLPETEVVIANEVDDYVQAVADSKVVDPVVVVLRGQWCRPIWWAAQKIRGYMKKPNEGARVPKETSQKESDILLLKKCNLKRT